jgi:hypothetical protein
MEAKARHDSLQSVTSESGIVRDLRRVLVFFSAMALLPNRATPFAGLSCCCCFSSLLFLHLTDYLPCKMASPTAPKQPSRKPPPPKQKKKTRLSGRQVVELVGRKIVFTLLGLGLGLFAFWQTQLILQEESFQEVGRACEAESSFSTRGDRSEEFLQTYHDYEPYVGGTFVCLLTQFLHALVQTWPAGFITWVATFCTFLPGIVLVVVEAGRNGAVGPLRFPSLILLLGQFFGISVAFPAVWVPAFIWGRNASGTLKGAISVKRAIASRFLILPAFVATVLAFAASPDSYLWTLTVGILGGPLLALFPLVCWFMDPPSNDKATSRMTYSVVTSYSIAGSLAFLLWAAVVATIVLNYRFDYQSLVKDCWTDAQGSVRFMTIDAVILYLGMLAYVGYVRTSAVAETLLQTVFFGPGAALAATMATLEMERNPLGTPRQQQQQQADADAAAAATRSKKE